MVGHSYSPHAFLQSSVSCAHPHYDALYGRSCSPVLTFHHLFLHSHGCSETDEHTRFSLLYSFRAVIVYVCVLRTGPSGMVCLCVNGIYKYIKGFYLYIVLLINTLTWPIVPFHLILVFFIKRPVNPNIENLNKTGLFVVSSFN